MKKSLFFRAMFTPKSEKKTRVRGVEKARYTFRSPPDLDHYIKSAEEGGYDKTEVIVRMLTLAKDVADQLETDWLEIERRAALEKVRPGVIVGRLVKELIARGRR